MKDLKLMYTFNMSTKNESMVHYVVYQLHNLLYILPSTPKVLLKMGTCELENKGNHVKVTRVN